jgi:hypothetical protein
MSRIIVHIDRLVLRGFRHEDRHAVADGLQAALGRHFAEPATARLLAARGNRTDLGPATVRVGPRMTPHRIGSQAGRAIAKGLTS